MTKLFRANYCQRRSLFFTFACDSSLSMQFAINNMRRQLKQMNSEPSDAFLPPRVIDRLKSFGVSTIDNKDLWTKSFREA